MDKKRRLDKDTRRERMAAMLHHDPGKTDRDLAEAFGVSVATVRLDRKMLGIPQMRNRLEAAVQNTAGESLHDLEIISLEQGREGLALVRTTNEMTDAAGIVPASKLYGMAAELVQTMMNRPFSPTQVGNIKYKQPCGSGVQLVVKAKVAHRHGSKQYVYVQITTRDTELFRAKFIMNILDEDEGDTDGKNSG